TEQQAKALRAAAGGRTDPRAGTNQPVANQPVDWEHLAEEIESLGVSERRELHSQVHRIIRHLLKLAFSPASPPRQGWIDSIDDARDMAARVLDASPSLRRELDALIAAEQPRGARAAIRDLGRYGELDPDTAGAIRNVRYGADQVLGDWFPPEPPAP
ncbi:MAG TPA: DUF29 domain-containing protein, partial [Stellaceae bacterium]|nr:DUF29 domain-containing protein [Stellaceae bacterium]